jgi:hypothetical protein
VEIEASLVSVLKSKITLWNRRFQRLFTEDFA